MANIEPRIEQFQKIAAEYEIISLLATTDFRRDMYSALACQYRQLAENRQAYDPEMLLTVRCG